MAFHEIYQVYNRQNKQFVKMKNGRILETSYFKFDDVPLFGSKEPEGEQSMPDPAKKESVQEAKCEPAEDVDNDDDDGVFSWF